MVQGNGQFGIVRTEVFFCNFLGLFRESLCPVQLAFMQKSLNDFIQPLDF